MNKNYRLRTQVGVDREIQVQLDQDWKYTQECVLIMV